MLAASTAQADAGDGIRTENLQLVPALQLSGAYDSNVFRTADAEAGRAIESAPTTTVEPSLSLQTIDPQTFGFKLDGAVRWEQYFSDQTALENQSGLSTEVNAAGHLNPKGDVSLEIEDFFSRTNEPPNFASGDPINRIFNRAGATVGIHPGARILNAYLSYDWKIYRHEPAYLEDLDRMAHDFTAKGQWKFLPKTSVIVQGDWGIIDYEEEADPDGVVTAIDSQPLRAKGGLSGLITRRLSAQVLAGYGNSMHEEGPSFSGPIGQAQLGYSFGRLSLKNKLMLGYKRGFQDSSIGNYFSLHQVYLRFEQGIIDRKLVFALGGDVEFRDYDGNAEAVEVEDGSATVEIGELSDTRTEGEAAIIGNPTKWLTLKAGYKLTANFTDDEIDANFVDPEQPDQVLLREFVRHYVSVSTQVRY